MISYGIVAAQYRKTPAVRAEFKGITSSTNFTGSALTLAVPAGASSGDTVFAVLRCRYDRTFSIPSGWNAIINGLQIGTTNGTMLYICYKTLASETSFTFTQNTSAACAGQIFVTSGSYSSISSGSGYTSSISSPSDNSLVVAVCVNNSTAFSGANFESSFSKKGDAYFLSGVTYYFCSSVATSQYASGTVSLSGTTWPGGAGLQYSSMILISPAS